MESHNISWCQQAWKSCCLPENDASDIRNKVFNAVNLDGNTGYTNIDDFLMLSSKRMLYRTCVIRLELLWNYTKILAKPCRNISLGLTELIPQQRMAGWLIFHSNTWCICSWRMLSWKTKFLDLFNRALILLKLTHFTNKPKKLSSSSLDP